MEQDYAQAFSLYKRAAEKGHAGAQCQTGYCLEKGLGVEADSAAAFRYYQLSADNGDETGCNNLGFMYDKGHGCTADAERAAFWFRRAAEKGMGQACKNYAILLEKGRGVEKNEALALEYYRKAADKGIDCAEAIKRLTTDKRSNRIAYTCAAIFCIIMAVVCGFAFFTDFNTSSGVSWAAGTSGAVLCLRMLRRYQNNPRKKLHPVLRYTLLALATVCGIISVSTLLVFATTQPMDFTALWCAVCFGAATAACIIGFAKK